MVTDPFPPAAYQRWVYQLHIRHYSYNGSDWQGLTDVSQCALSETLRLYLGELDVRLHERQLQQLLSGRQQNTVVFVHEQLVEVRVMSRADAHNQQPYTHVQTHISSMNLDQPRYARWTWVSHVHLGQPGKPGSARCTWVRLDQPGEPGSASAHPSDWVSRVNPGQPSEP